LSYYIRNILCFFISGNRQRADEAGTVFGGRRLLYASCTARQQERRLLLQPVCYVVFVNFGLNMVVWSSEKL